MRSNTGWFYQDLDNLSDFLWSKLSFFAFSTFTYPLTASLSHFVCSVKKPCNKGKMGRTLKFYLGYQGRYWQNHCFGFPGSVTYIDIVWQGRAGWIEQKFGKEAGNKDSLLGCPRCNQQVCSCGCILLPCGELVSLEKTPYSGRWRNSVSLWTFLGI